MPYFCSMSRLRTHFPFFYRFAAFLALLAMLTPVATVTAHHPAAAQNLMRICGVDTQKDSSKDTPHKLPSCPICLSLHILGGGFVPPAPITFVADAPATAMYNAPHRLFRIAFIAWPQARPRAPPSIA